MDIVPESKAPQITAIPDGKDLFYFKLVGIGPKTLEAASGSLASIVSGVDGYYLIASPDEIEKEIHEIVSRAFARRAKQMENRDG